MILSMWIWPVSGALALIGGFVWSLTRVPSRDEIPMNDERRQMFVKREQKDRLGAS